MLKWFLTGISIFVVEYASSVSAADVPVKAPAPAPWSWAGLYIGVHAGSAMGLNNVNDPLGSSIFGDQIHSPGFFGGGQIGFNWQAPSSSWVFGVEADASLGNLDGTNTCFAFSGTFTSFNCRAHMDAFGTATGRVGLAFGPFGRSLAYVKGGLAWGHSDVDMIVNNELFGVASGNTSHNSFTSVGWTIGGGVEYAVTPHWTVKAEYDYLDLGSTGVTAPAQSVITNPAVTIINPTTVEITGARVAVPGTSVSQQIHAFKLGMNYKFDADTAPFPSAAVFPEAVASGWGIAVGGRYWYSWGRFQKDLAPGVLGPQNPTLNVSRLTWDDLTGHSGEGFGRIDTPWNFFAKGFAGGGKINGGKINDEDWGLLFPSAAVGYSNTVGNATGNLSYWTIDGGYDFVRGPGMKVGAFVGYNEYHDNKSSFTCSEIALPASGICNPPLNEFVLGQNDKWQSLRVGGNGEVMLTDRLKLAADVAYLPYVKFTGQDVHPLRPFVADETGRGIGTQAELFLDYYLTPQFSLGAGGRYWAMWTTSGTACRLPPDGACPVPLQNAQLKTERYGLLLQAAYKFLP